MIIHEGHKNPKSEYKIDAHEARRRAEDATKEELNKVIRLILEVSEKGETNVFLYWDIQKITLMELLSRGFTVKEHNSTEIQKDGLHFTITW